MQPRILIHNNIFQKMTVANSLMCQRVAGPVLEAKTSILRETYMKYMKHTFSEQLSINQ